MPNTADFGRWLFGQHIVEFRMQQMIMPEAVCMKVNKPQPFLQHPDEPSGTEFLWAGLDIRTS